MELVRIHFDFNCSKKLSVKRGELFLSYVIWYSFGRFFIEGMRTDSLYAFGGIRVSQVLSLILFAGGLFLFYYRRKKRTDIKLYERDKGTNQALI